MPTLINGFEIHDRNEVPEAQPQRPRRGAKRKYPWWEMQPGQAFRFSGDVKEQSARVQASAASGMSNYEFKVYTGKDGFLWCMRVDGLSRTEWPDVPRENRERVPIAAPAEVADAVGTIDETFVAKNHNATGGVPAEFGYKPLEDAGAVAGQAGQTDGIVDPADPFATDADAEWRRRAGPMPVEPYVPQSHDDGDWGSPEDDSLVGKDVI